MEDILMPLVGGVLIGLAAAGFMLFNGRIAGISGIIGPLVTAPKAGDRAWRVAFLLGMAGGGAALFFIKPELFASSLDRSLPAVAVAGLLVGFGTRLGSGCTSGHGICGLARLSPRSFVAVGSFVAAGMLLATVVTQVFGGNV